MSGEFVIFEDESIRMSIPSYLQKKKAIRFFSANRRKIKQTAISDVAVDIWLDKVAFATFKNKLANARQHDSIDGFNQLLRRGEVDYGGIGYESLWHSTNQHTGVEFLRYDIVLQCKEKVITISISGQGDGNIFYELCG